MASATPLDAPAADALAAPAPSLAVESAAAPPSLAWVGAFTASLIAVAPLAPVGALFLTVALYATAAEAPLPPPLDGLTGLLTHPILAGPVHFLIVWLLLAALCLLLGFASVDRVDRHSYSALITNRDRLAARARLIAERAEHSAALDEARLHLEKVAEGVQESGPQWVLANGYTSLWRTAQYAEEAVIEAAIEAGLDQQLLRDALHDRLRVRDSNMENRADLLAKLDGAIDVLTRSIGRQEASSGAAGAGDTAGALAATGSTTAAPPMSLVEAREAVLLTRRVINDLLSDRWSGLVRARNRLFATITFTGVTLYGLFWLGIIAGVHQSTLNAAMSFYLVGATVGLFNRLYADSAAVSEGADYNLAITRLLGVPLLSGTASVLGVVIVSMAAIIQQGAPGTASGAGSSSLLEVLAAINQPINMVTAAIFGLTPGLVVDRLTEQTDKAKQDLNKMKPRGTAQS